MTEYTFFINGEYTTAKVDNVEGTLKEARIEEGEEYSLVETDIYRENPVEIHEHRI